MEDECREEGRRELIGGKRRAVKMREESEEEGN